MGLIADKGKKERRSSSRTHPRTLGRSLSEMEPSIVSPARRRKKASKGKNGDGSRSAKVPKRVKGAKEHTTARRVSTHAGHRREGLEKPSPPEPCNVTSTAISSKVIAALESLPWFKEQWAAEQDAQKKQAMADVVNGLRSLGIEIAAAQVIKKEWVKMENDLSFQLPPEAVESVRRRALETCGAHLTLAGICGN